MFFAITIFLEGWRLEDCKYHLPRLRDPKYVSKGLLSFGRNLDWSLQDIRNRGNSSIVLETEHLTRQSWTLLGQKIPRKAPARYAVTYIHTLTISNIVKTRAKDFRDASQHGEADLEVEYEGGSYSSSYLRTVSSYLTASLFYLELLYSPRFYQSPETCYAIVRCRIPSGDGLLALLRKLKNNKACLLFRGDELDYCWTELCGFETMRACREGKPFERYIQMKVNSPHSKLDVQIAFSTGVKRTISKLPCVLGTLVKEQGRSLCTMTKNTYKYMKPENSRFSEVQLQTEFNRLQNTLHQCIYTCN